METKINQTVAESQNENIKQGKQMVETISKDIDNKLKSSKKTLTPYQQYKNSRNQNGKKYFEFYDDVKVYTHNIWDW